MGNMTFRNRETALNTLADAARVLVIFVGNSNDMGIYWLDLDNHTLYLAKKLQIGWSHSRDMMTWTGTQFVYGSKPRGFWSLASNGEHQQITDFGYKGKIANNGEQILRFRKCGPNKKGASYTITPLARFTDPPLICVPRHSESEPEAWFYVRPVWNPHLPQADFVVSKRFGKNKDMVIEWSKLIETSEGGERREIINLGGVFPAWFENDIQPRPDGQAFYIHNETLNSSSIIDRSGDKLVELATLDSQLPHLQRARRFSWSPDSQKAALLFDDCRQSDETCDKVLVLLTNNFTTLDEIVTLPAKFRFNHMIWSPDSTHIGFVTDIHQGAKDPPRIYTINLINKSVADYIFPTQFILNKVQWVR